MLGDSLLEAHAFLRRAAGLHPRAGLRGEEIPMTNMLKDKVVLITGAGGGIGREMALLAAREGAAVVVNDLGAAVDGEGAASRTPAQSVCDEIAAAGGKASPNY